MNSEYEQIIKQKIELIQRWKGSSAYRQLCLHFQTACDKLIQIGTEFLSQKDKQDALEKAVIRTIFSSDGGMHRGIYCPSPVYDIIVGNVRRGKRTKQSPANSKSYFQYGFDACNQLVWVRQFSGGRPVSTEYLLYHENDVYGVTIDNNFRLQCITEERYINNILSVYTNALIAPQNGQYVGIRMHTEQYEFDLDGLKTATWYNYSPIMNALSRKDYHFTCENGYLIRYSATERIGEQDYPSKQTAPEYSIKIKRESFFNPFTST